MIATAVEFGVLSLLFSNTHMAAPGQPDLIAAERCAELRGSISG